MIAGSSPACIVRLSRVSKTYGARERERRVLGPVTLQTGRGELLLIMGPSGSGKTTLLTIIAGLRSASSGRMELFGRSIDRYASHELQRLRATRIGFIYQTFHLIDSLTVLENVMLVMRFAHVEYTRARHGSMELLEAVGIDHLASACPSTLSQGEKQRVAVARALANNADLILADEPTSSISSAQGLEITRLLHQQTEHWDRCVIVVSHDERIAGYADRVLHLVDGRIVEHHASNLPSRCRITAERG